MAPRELSTADMGLMHFGANGSSEAENSLAQCAIDWSGPKYARVDWERGAGTAETDTGTVTLFADALEFDPLYLVWVKRSVGSGQSEIDVYVNGVLKDTLGPLTDATGGTDADAELFIASTFFGSFSTTEAQRGMIQDARLSNIARSSTAILACYNAGLPGDAEIVRQNPELTRTSP
jgi:hypothetical protein